MPFGIHPFCLLDIETTGFSADFNEITEIAALRVNERFEVTGQMSRLVRISGSMPYRVTTITGITDAMLRREGRPLLEVLNEAGEFISGVPTFAHNAGFDRRFLDCFASRLGLEVRFPLMCSIPVFKRLRPGMGSYSLPAIAEAIRVDGGGTHRALEDCRVLLECLRRVHPQRRSSLT